MHTILTLLKLKLKPTTCQSKVGLNYNIVKESNLMLASFGFFGPRRWIQLLALTAGFQTSVTIRNFKKLQYKRFKAKKISDIRCSIQKINFLYLKNWINILTPETKTYGLFYTILILYDLGTYLVATQLRQLNNVKIMNLNLLTILL